MKNKTLKLSRYGLVPPNLQFTRGHFQSEGYKPVYTQLNELDTLDTRLKYIYVP